MNESHRQDDESIQLATDEQLYSIYKGVFWAPRPGVDREQTDRDKCLKMVKRLHELIRYENWVIPHGSSDFKTTAATIPLSAWRKTDGGEVEPTTICLVTHVSTQKEHRGKGHAKRLLRSLPFIKGDPSLLPSRPVDLPKVASEGSRVQCIGSQLMTHLPDSFYGNMNIGDTELSRKGWQMDHQYNKELKITSTYRLSSPRSGWKWGSDGELIKYTDLDRLCEKWSQKTKQGLEETHVSRGETLISMDPASLPKLVEAKLCLDTFYMSYRSVHPPTESCGFYLLSKNNQESSHVEMDISVQPCVLINRFESRLILSLMDNVTPEHLPDIIRGVEEYSLKLPLSMPDSWSMVIWGNTDDAISTKWKEMGGEEIDKITTDTDENGHQRYAFASWGPTGTKVEMSSAEAWSHSFD